MYLMYVDESGDPGAWQPVPNPPSQHYILSGLILPASQWQVCFQQYLQFRRQLRTQFGLPIRTEIHATELIRPSGNLTYQRIRKRDRMTLFEMCMQAFPSIFASGCVVNVYVNKQARYGQPNALPDYLDFAWRVLLQRYHNFLARNAGNAPGIVFSDDSSNDAIRRVIRRVRRWNPVPARYGAPSYRNIPLMNIIEDPVFRNSAHSYFIQVVDMIAHSLYRREYPKGSLRRFNVHTYFNHLRPILLRAAAPNDPDGIVRL